MSLHLSPADITRVLSFDRDDDGVTALEAHASTCDECTERLAEEAALVIAIDDAASRRSKETAQRKAPRRLLMRVGALAIAAGALLFVGYEARHPKVAIVPDFAVGPAGPTRTDHESDPWHLAGSPPQKYRLVTSGGAHVLTRDDGPKAEGFGTVMQSFAAESYRGKRVRFSAEVTTRGVDHWAGLWMRVDVPGATGAFDNMNDRPIRGTTLAARVEVVLDVSADATAIALGLLLEGSGEASFADPRFEIVGADVPTTAGSVKPLAPDFRP